MKVRIAIIGSRGFDDYDFLTYNMAMLEEKHGWDIIEIISGGARGADRLGVKMAKEAGIPYKEFIPDWETYKKAAGYLRNQLIIDHCDIVVAFWDGISRGTKHSLDLAKAAGKEVIVIYVNEIIYKSKNHIINL